MKTMMKLFATVVMVFTISTCVKAADIELLNSTIEYETDDIEYLHFTMHEENQDLNRVEIVNDDELGMGFETIWAPEDPEAYTEDYNISVAVYGVSYMNGSYNTNIKVYDDFGNLLDEQVIPFEVINYTFTEPEVSVSENSVSENSVDEVEEETFETTDDNEYFDIGSINVESEETSEATVISNDVVVYEESIVDVADDDEDVVEEEDEEEIEVAAPKVTKIKKGKKFQLKIKVEKGSKIQIKYYNGKKWKTTSKKSIKLKKSWKVKVRAYKVIDGIKYYSDWVISR